MTDDHSSDKRLAPKVSTKRTFNLSIVCTFFQIRSLYHYPLPASLVLPKLLLVRELVPSPQLSCPCVFQSAFGVSEELDSRHLTMNHQVRFPTPYNDSRHLTMNHQVRALLVWRTGSDSAQDEHRESEGAMIKHMHCTTACLWSSPSQVSPGLPCAISPTPTLPSSHSWHFIVWAPLSGTRTRDFDPRAVRRPSPTFHVGTPPPPSPPPPFRRFFNSHIPLAKMISYRVRRRFKFRISLQLLLSCNFPHLAPQNSQLPRPA